MKKVGRLSNSYTFTHFGKIFKKNPMLLYMYISNFKGIFVENIWIRIKMKYYINQRGCTYKEKTLQL